MDINELPYPRPSSTRAATEAFFLMIKYAMDDLKGWLDESNFDGKAKTKTSLREQMKNSGPSTRGL